MLSAKDEKGSTMTTKIQQVSVSAQIEVMLAYKNGSRIEARKRCTERWEPVAYPLWNWDDFDYRIKPDPGFTPEQQAIIDAYSSGVPLEVQKIDGSSDWEPLNKCPKGARSSDLAWAFLFSRHRYRIKPTLRLRRPEEFPPIWWLKSPVRDAWYLVSIIDSNQFRTNGPDRIWEEINEKDQWSDRPFGEPRSFFVEVE